MVTYNCDGNAVIIPSLQESEDGKTRRVSNAEDMALLIRTMGYSNEAEFQKETKRTPTDLIGKWWGIIGGDVFELG